MDLKGSVWWVLIIVYFVFRHHPKQDMGHFCHPNSSLCPLLVTKLFKNEFNSCIIGRRVMREHKLGDRIKSIPPGYD